MSTRLQRAWRALRAAGTLVLGALALQPLQAADAPANYTIGAGDLLRFAVFQQPDLSLETRVSESGMISFPLLGAVRLGGLTVAQAEAEITRGLREGSFLQQPQVTLLLVSVRGNQVSVLGLVNKPGRFPLDVVGMRLSELLALAGGLAPGANDIVTLSGERDGKAFRSEVDLPALYGRQPSGTDPELRNGDVVFVDRSPVVYVHGEVQRPGSFRLERDMSAMQAVAASGGVTLRGTLRGLRVHRRDPEGKLQMLQPGLADKLQDGDVVFVRESLF
ncbi:polysaccharide export protein EpsE [Rubrivivax sp. RP6-9]|uniref:polysaccharide export protein EpsE n=1 Tax=Rubrivivax sp. RP6-9 TaxID=3415750 RepID=UPI003CC5F8D4